MAEITLLILKQNYKNYVMKRAEIDFISKCQIKKLPFRNPLDGILCLLGEFYVKKFRENGDHAERILRPYAMDMNM